MTLYLKATVTDNGDGTTTVTEAPSSKAGQSLLADTEFEWLGSTDDMCAHIVAIEHEVRAEKRLQKAEAKFILAARQLNRIREECGLEHLSVKDLPGFDDGGQSGEQGETKRDGDTDSAHDESPLGRLTEPR